MPQPKNETPRTHKAKPTSEKQDTRRRTEPKANKPEDRTRSSEQNR